MQWIMWIVGCGLLGTTLVSGSVSAAILASGCFIGFSIIQARKS